MKRYLGVTALLFIAGSAHAQVKPPAGGAKAPAPAANAPAANTPAAKPAAGTPAAANAPAANAPAANAPTASAPAANAPAANTPAGNAPAANSGPKVTVKVPTGGDYTAYILENPTAARVKVTDKAEVELPGTGGTFNLFVLDNRSGYAAKKVIEAKSVPTELTFDGPNFTLVQKVRVQATGKDGKLLAKGSVTLADSSNAPLRDDIQPSDQGIAEFEFVPKGEAKLTATADNGTSSTNPVTIGLGPNEAMQTLSVSLPTVEDVLEGTGTAPANAPAVNAPAANTAAPAPAPTAPPTTAAPAPAQPLPPPDSGGNWGGTVVGFLFLAALIGGGYLYAKNRGITIDTVLKKLGVQPDTAVAGGGSLAGANLAGAAPAPGTPPPPPPVVADPNQCPFCGQMKDANGGCACVVTPGAAPAASGAPASYGGATGGGPRLVGMAGTYMGTVFPIQGTMTIGREPSNGVPLDRDTTSSRRHAQISAEGGFYRVQDLGSSNGTFVNGARVSESLLNPGDEVSIGGTRFRFEV